MEQEVAHARMKLQDALELLPAEIHHKILPSTRTIALHRTSKTMRTAVEKADAVVVSRGGVQFREGEGLLDKLNSLNAWCKVTVLRVNSCGLGEGGGRALAEILRVNSTVTLLNLELNNVGDGAGQAIAEALRVNTTVTSLNLCGNNIEEGGELALRQSWGDREGHLVGPLS